MTGDKSLSLTSDAMARKIFADVLLPLTADSRNHISFKTFAGDGTYFLPARRPTINKDQMAEIGAKGELVVLGEYWEQNFPGLQKLLPHLEELALEIEKERLERASDPGGPSESIYQMW